jgi:hypothetical protein
MRIAVSGTHCSGKTTLIEEFLRAHPEFGHEPEAYTVMVDDFGEEFSSEPGADDFYRQLEFDVYRLSGRPPDVSVIIERSPIDYLAYLLALKDLKRDKVDDVVEIALPLVREAIQNLDLIVFLPLDAAHAIELRDDEDPKLRRATDRRLAAIFGDDEYDFFNAGDLAIVEVRGSTAQRLKTLEDAIDSYGLDLDDFVTAWIAYQEAEEDSPEQERLQWVSDQVIFWGLDQEGDALWEFVLEAYERELSPGVIGVLAAGPLEDLLARQGAEFIDRVEELARKDPKFNYLLGGVWRNKMTDDVWQRVQAARHETW